MLVHIAVVKWHSNKTTGVEPSHGDEQMYETVGIDPAYMEMEGGGGGGGGGDAYKLQNNEAYATHM